MKRNVGNADRAARILLAIIFGVLYLSGIVTGTLGYVMLGLGVVFALTSLVSFCPLYAIFGINTCPSRKEI